MEVECICCKIKMSNPAGFQTRNGFICMRHEFESKKVWRVSFDGMGDFIAGEKFFAESFVEEDCLENDTRKSEYLIIEEKMNVLLYNNLEDWDG